MKINNLLESYYKGKIDFINLKAKLIIESSNIDEKNKFQKDFRFCQNISDVEKILPLTTLKIKTTLAEQKTKSKNKKILNESFKRVLKEVDEDIEYLDKNALFDSLTASISSISEAFNAIYPFKNQYIENPNLKNALRELRLSLSDSLDKLTELTKIAGLENDLKSKSVE